MHFVIEEKNLPDSVKCVQKMKFGSMRKFDQPQRLISEFDYARIKQVNVLENIYDRNKIGSQTVQRMSLSIGKKETVCPYKQGVRTCLE